MKDQALEAAEKRQGHAKLAALREYLQAEILFALQNRNAFEHLAFVGGTALRFLYGLGRYSEDLDFSGTGKKFEPEDLWKRVCVDLSDAGYRVTAHPKKEKKGHAVRGLFFRFEGLLYEAHVSPHKTEKLAIRVEVDLRPPAGAVLETTLVRRHLLLGLRHYDLPSLFAGKCHAVLQRQYTKGRDLYDLVWYLTRKSLDPNFALLNNALRQTKWNGPKAEESSWRELLAKQVQSMNWKNVSKELATFLESPQEARTITKESVLSLLNK